jgi:hypothetical protein
MALEETRPEAEPAHRAERAGRMAGPRPVRPSGCAVPGLAAAARHPFDALSLHPAEPRLLRHVRGHAAVHQLRLLGHRRHQSLSWTGPMSALEQYGFLLDCDNYLDPTTCREDRFWNGVFNTRHLRLLPGQPDRPVLADHGIDPEPRDPRRGFFRAAFFFPVLLSPVVVALIWKWILLRDGVLNAFLVSIGLDPILFFVSPVWAMFWAIFVSVWAHMGFYTLILLAGLQAIPARSLRGRRDGRHQARTRFLPHHAAASVAQHAGRHRAGADQGGADLRRGLRADRRRTGHRDPVHRAVHLQRPASRTRCRISASPRPPRSCSAWSCSC